MPNDFISREEALIEMDRLKQSADDENEFEETCAYETAKEALLSLPSADVAPVIHAKWVRRANGVNDPECSVCGWAIPDDTDEGLQIRRGYCGHCGARMDGGEPHAD